VPEGPVHVSPRKCVHGKSSQRFRSPLGLLFSLGGHICSTNCTVDVDVFKAAGDRHDGDKVASAVIGDAGSRRRADRAG
jgi:hypothetical protein